MMQLVITFRAERLRVLLYSLIGTGVGLALLHLVIKATAEHLPWGPLEAIFDLDEEISIPTWFSSVQLFVIGAVLALASVENRRRQEVPNWLLRAGAMIFLLLSMDEGAMLHERFTAVARRLEIDWLLFGEGRGAWQLPYALLALAAVLIAFRPLIRIARAFPVETRFAVIGAALVAVGAAGLELVSYYTVPEPVGFWYELEVVSEEALEMAGASLILYATLRLAAGIAGDPATTPR